MSYILFKLNTDSYLLKMMVRTSTSSFFEYAWKQVLQFHILKKRHFFCIKTKQNETKTTKTTNHSFIIKLLWWLSLLNLCSSDNSRGSLDTCWEFMQPSPFSSVVSQSNTNPKRRKKNQNHIMKVNNKFSQYRRQHKELDHPVAHGYPMWAMHAFKDLGALKN